MATSLLQREHVGAGLFRRYRAWRLYRALRTLAARSSAEIEWLRSELAIARKTNTRISQVNEQFSKEIEELKRELAYSRIIDPTHPCLVCGNRSGNKLKAIPVGMQNQKGSVVAQLTCGNCGFQQAHEPVRSDAFEHWQPTPTGEEMQPGSILGL